MYTVNLTRKFRRAALIALPLVLMACSTDRIVGLDPEDALLAKKASGDAGKLVWTPAGTYYDYGSRTFHYQISSLSSYQSYTITATAWVTASYDCVDESSNVAMSFAGVSETIVGTTTGQANKKGQASGSILLGPNGSLQCAGGLQPDNFVVLSTSTVRVVSDPPNRSM